MLTKSGSRWVPARGWLLLTAVLVITAIALLIWAKGGRDAGSSQQGSNPADVESRAHTQFAIVGMDCVMCAAGLQNRLRALPGVTRAEVSYQDKTAVIEYDPRLINAARFETIVEGEGFKVGLQTPARTLVEPRAPRAR